MKLADKVIYLHEGGLVKLPIELQKKVIGGAKEVVTGITLDALNGVRKQYGNILSSIPDDTEVYKRIEKLLALIDKYVKIYSKRYKARKSNVNKKKIVIKKSDMLPYEVEDDFTILLRTTTTYSRGTNGSITTKKGDDGFHSEIPLAINFARLGGSIDVLRSMTKNAPNVFRMLMDGKKSTEEAVINMLDTLFLNFKEFQNGIQKETEEAVSIIRHELTHVVQHQTGQGYNHKDFNKEGGYIKMKGKSARAYNSYAVGSKEFKAYLSNTVDLFFTRYKDKDMSLNDAIKEFVDNDFWFKAVKKSDKKKEAIKDFTIIVNRDRRVKRFK